MKFQYFFLSLLFLLTGACSEEVIVNWDNGENIRFSSPAVTVETLGRSTFYDEFPQGGEFGVLGYCVPYKRGSTTDPDWESGTSLWDIKRTNIHPDVFYQQRVVYNGNSCTYNYDGEGASDGLRKWYNVTDYPDAVHADDFRYTFFAYYPYSHFELDEPVAADKIGAPKLTFTMPFSEGGDVERLLDDSATPDAMIAVEYNHLRSSGNVSFNFNHILVGLGFAANNYNYGEDGSVIITDVVLKGHFTRSMTIDFNKNTNDGDFYFCSGTYSGYYQIFNGNLEVKANESVSPIGDKHILLLSDAQGGTYFGTDIAVKISYIYKGESKTATLQRPSDFTPRVGVKYTANLNFVGETFLLNFVAATDGFWDNGGDSNITIQ